jgi:hypothetical protein
MPTGRLAAAQPAPRTPGWPRPRPTSCASFDPPPGRVHSDRQPRMQPVHGGVREAGRATAVTVAGRLHAGTSRIPVTCTGPPRLVAPAVTDDKSRTARSHGVIYSTPRPSRWMTGSRCYPSAGDHPTYEARLDGPSSRGAHVSTIRLHWSGHRPGARRDAVGGRRSWRLRIARAYWVADSAGACCDGDGSCRSACVGTRVRR